MLLERMADLIEKQNMIPSGTRLICGVSGGADSVALLLLLRELQQNREKFRNVGPFDIEVVHVEHGIRGEESLADAVFTEELCQTSGVPLTMISLDVPAYAAEQGLGLEEAARLLRYQALQSRVRERATDRIVLAHHMNDRAETILFQLARGSSIKGMTGIAPLRYDRQGYCYIRPLLEIRREEIEEYLRGKGQSWREDRTNQEIEYSRNRIRHQIIPELEQINHQAVAHINQTAMQLEEIADFLHQQVMEKYPEIVFKSEKGIDVDIARLNACHPALRKALLMEVLEQICGQKKDIGSLHVDQILTLSMGQSGKKIPLPYGIIAEKVFDHLHFSPKEGPGKRGAIELRSLPCRILLEQGSLNFTIFPFDGDFDKIPKNSYTKWYDYDKIKNGLCIRSRQPGDYLCVDRQGHRKKLRRYLMEEKIPERERDDVLLLASGEEILWVIGRRGGQTAPVTAETKTILEAHLSI